VQQSDQRFGSVPERITDKDLQHPLDVTAGGRLEALMDNRKYLTVEEVADRYRGSISVGTLRNWRAMRVGPAYVKIGKAVLYPVSDLDAWDEKNKVICRASKGFADQVSD
jgi:hypothetical protein